MCAESTERRALGLDVGLRRTGIALSDPGGTLATPLETVALSPRELLAHLIRLIRTQGVDRVVIGLPRLPSGDEGEVAGLARRIGASLTSETGVSVLFRDEALTSWEAQELLGRGRAGGRSAGRGPRARARARGEIDRVAAALVLQEYLDECRGRGRGAAGAGDTGTGPEGRGH